MSEDLREIVEAATPGPWEMRRWGIETDVWPERRITVGRTAPNGEAIAVNPRYSWREEDFRFIATFNPERVSLMLAREKQLEAVKEQRKIDREEFQLACDQIDQLEAQLEAAQEVIEAARQLREALEQIEQLDRMGHNSEVAAEMGYIARAALDAPRFRGGKHRGG